MCLEAPLDGDPCDADGPAAAGSPVDCGGSNSIEDVLNGNDRGALDLDGVAAEVSFDGLHKGLGAERLGDVTGGSGHASADLVKEAILS